MIEIKFELKDMNGISLKLGDNVKIYDERAFNKNGKLIKSKAKYCYQEGTIHWHNGSGGMWSNGVVVNRENAGKFEAICTINPNSTLNGYDDEVNKNADTCWYIEKVSK